jgi:hypothetical protein
MTNLAFHLASKRRPPTRRDQKANHGYPYRRELRPRLPTRMALHTTHQLQQKALQ